MYEVKYNSVTVEVPTSWEDITLGFWESFCAEKPGTSRELVEYAAKACKADAGLLFSWPAEVFDLIVDKMEFLFNDMPMEPDPRIEIGKVTYVVPIEDKLTLGAWVDVDEVQKRGENVFSNILAIVCRPVGEDYDDDNNETRQAMFAGLPVSKVLGVIAFFLHCKAVSDQRTKAYSQLAQALDRLPPSTRCLPNRGGGIRLSRIWPTLKYYVWMTLLRCRLQKFLHSYSTGGTRN